MCIVYGIIIFILNVVMIVYNFPQVLGFYVHTTMSMLQFQFHFGFFQVELPFSLFPPA